MVLPDGRYQVISGSGKAVASQSRAIGAWSGTVKDSAELNNIFMKEML